MKKILCVASLMVLVWGCAKKMTPSKTETGTTNSGSVSANTQPMSTDPNLGKGTGSAVTSTITTTTGTGTTENATFAGARVPTATTPEAAAAIAGQKTYNAKCGGCHGLKVTTEYSSDRWASILAVMAPKANLTETEKNNVYAYVKENSKK
ncbi:MAG TPA: cytochrome c [Ferruginibacter sp.]|nr:cytochrome c [Ferruginibacter sp.]